MATEESFLETTSLETTENRVTADREYRENTENEENRELTRKLLNVKLRQPKLKFKFKFEDKNKSKSRESDNDSDRNKAEAKEDTKAEGKDDTNRVIEATETIEITEPNAVLVGRAMSLEARDSEGGTGLAKTVEGVETCDTRRHRELPLRVRSDVRKITAIRSAWRQCRSDSLIDLTDIKDVTASKVTLDDDSVKKVIEFEGSAEKLKLNTVGSSGSNVDFPGKADNGTVRITVVDDTVRNDMARNTGTDSTVKTVMNGDQLLSAYECQPASLPVNTVINITDMSGNQLLSVYDCQSASEDIVNSNNLPDSTRDLFARSRTCSVSGTDQKLNVNVMPDELDCQITGAYYCTSRTCSDGHGSNDGHDTSVKSVKSVESETRESEIEPKLSVKLKSDLISYEGPKLSVKSKSDLISYEGPNSEIEHEIVTFEGGGPKIGLKSDTRAPPDTNIEP